jgi:hypothetical protein
VDHDPGVMQVFENGFLEKVIDYKNYVIPSSRVVRTSWSSIPAAIIVVSQNMENHGMFGTFSRCALSFP